MKNYASLVITTGIALQLVTTDATLVQSQACINSDKIDVLWILDASSSLRTPEWENLKESVASFTDKIRVGPQHARISAIPYSTNVIDAVELSSPIATDATLFKNWVRNLKRPSRGFTDTPEAIFEASKMLKDSVFRPGSKRLIVVATDNTPNRKGGCNSHGLSA
mmetsp:Transcript_14079/g.22996  ORF Transcript_14079/g.22996 Transcript_14079/m.22996 type:complete len:165 (+) Transcript_14079:431-925(+)